MCSQEVLLSNQSYAETGLCNRPISDYEKHQSQRVHRHQTSRTIQIIVIRMITPTQVTNVPTSISVGPDRSGYSTRVQPIIPN